MSSPEIAPEVPSTPIASVPSRIAAELGVLEWQVIAAIEMLDGGATVPFIARYRKEATGTLDDAQLRDLEERLTYLRELDDRRAAVVEAIRSQGKLTVELEKRLTAADSKARLEDIYLPFKTKRRTKAQIAREAGLQPLADSLLGDPSEYPERAAARYVNPDKGVADIAEALLGARSILVERFGEDADLVGGLRELLWTRGRLVSAVRVGKEQDGAKFSDYFDFAEKLTTLPSHRVLAMFRGEKDDVLNVSVSSDSPDPDPDPLDATPTDYERRIAARFGIVDRGSPSDKWLRETVRWAWRTRLSVSWESMCGCACGRAPSRLQPPSSPQICGISCWRRRPAAGRRSDSTLVSAPASRWPSSTAPERSSRSTPSTRTSRTIDGMQRWRRCTS